MQKTDLKTKGFTIIETVIVLAIASLMFMAVFWAVPNLRKSQRDTVRRTHLSYMIAEMDTYRAQAGRVPVTASDIAFFNDAYLANSNYVDPLAGPYVIEGIEVDTAGGHSVYPEELGQVFYKARHFCADGPYIEGETDIIEHVAEYHSTAAVWVLGELGGVICVDNGTER